MSDIFTCEDIAQRYGVKLITVWDWIRKKKLPAIRIGKRYYIRKEDIESFEKAAQRKSS